MTVKFIQLFENNDREYLAAVQAGDMATCQRMVDEAAKKAGFTVKGYHGTTNQFTEFDTNKQSAGRYGDGFYFYNNPTMASGFNLTTKSRVVEAFLKLENPVTPQPDGEYLDWGGKTIEDGDSVIVPPNAQGDVIYVVRNPSQIKSADPVTRESGNVILLSHRFDSSDNRITH
jgi:hypothetical protein